MSDLISKISNISDSGLDLELARVIFEKLSEPMGFDLTRGIWVSHGIDPHVEYKESNTGFLWFGYLMALENTIANAPAVESGEAFCYINPMFLENRNRLGGEFAFFKPNHLCVPLYLAPPQAQTVRDALEKAVEAIGEWKEGNNKLGKFIYRNEAVEAIRTLIEEVK